MEIEIVNERRKKIVSFSNGGRLMFNQMDKFQHGTKQDIAWAKLIGLSDLTTLKLTPIMHLVVKELLQSIVQLNVDAIESMVQGVPIIITENHAIKMLCLS